LHFTQNWTTRSPMWKWQRRIQISWADSVMHLNCV